MPSLEQWQDRFWAKVRLDPSGCWIWTASQQSKGYGQFGSRSGGCRRGKSTQAHRIAYELRVGPIPEGMTLDHLCRNTLCVNPDHLEPVTRGENVLRGVGFSATNARKTHCPRGHDLTGENVYVTPTGRRNCRTCRREQLRQFRARQR